MERYYLSNTMDVQYEGFLFGMEFVDFLAIGDTLQFICQFHNRAAIFCATIRRFPKTTECYLHAEARIIYTGIAR